MSTPKSIDDIDTDKPSIYQRPEGVLLEAEIHEAPLEPCHRKLALKHFHRLTKTLAAEDKDLVGRNTTRASAREHLARLTLVIRDYMSEMAKGQREDATIESMIADVVDASLFVDNSQGTWSQPAFVNPLFMGREHEIASIMQDISAQGVDDVDALELWDALPPSPSRANKVLPDHEDAWDVGIGNVDWPLIFLLSRRSEDDLTYRTRDKTFMDAERVVYNARLAAPLECRLRYNWPPGAGEGLLTPRLQLPADSSGPWKGPRTRYPTPAVATPADVTPAYSTPADTTLIPASRPSEPLRAAAINQEEPLGVTTRKSRQCPVRADGSGRAVP